MIGLLISAPSMSNSLLTPADPLQVGARCKGSF